MNRIPVIDLTATGINIARLRVNAGFLKLISELGFDAYHPMIIEL